MQEVLQLPGTWQMLLWHLKSQQATQHRRCFSNLGVALGRRSSAWRQRWPSSPAVLGNLNTEQWQECTGLITLAWTS